MDEGAQAPSPSTDVNAAPAAPADTQAPATPASSTEEIKELEVVYEGLPAKADDVQEGADPKDPANPAENRESAEDPGKDGEGNDQPREDKKRGAEARIRQLNEEKKSLEIQLADALSRVLPEYDVDKAIADGKDPAEARLEALEQKDLHRELGAAVTGLNVELNQQANYVERDFPYMDTTNENRTPEEIAFAEEVTEMWFQAADVKVKTDPTTGAKFITQAKIPLYDFVKKMDGIRNSGRQSGEAQGQRNAEQQLAAVEIPTGPAPRKDARSDASLSPDEYAKKHGLQVVEG